MLYSEKLTSWLKEKKIYLKYSTYTNYCNVIHNHILPYHNHEAYSTVLLRENGDGNIQSAPNNSYWHGGQKDNTTYIGGDAKHNNISPCITVFIWKRVK